MDDTLPIKLVLPHVQYRHQVEDFVQKMQAIDGSNDDFHGCGNLDVLTFDDWLKECTDWQQGINMRPGHVPSTQYMAIDGRTDKLIGMIAIRHRLTQYLERFGGHIGYCVAPDERRKGYATQMLRLALEQCKYMGIKRVRVTCNYRDLASSGVIKKCDGVYDGDAVYDGEVIERYWIDLE
jgi:predicted acetyltransferase